MEIDNAKSQKSTKKRGLSKMKSPFYSNEYSLDVFQLVEMLYYSNKNKNTKNTTHRR